jgi:hypothetical protein
MTGLPTISVVLPNYNHARYVGGALQALLGQSVPPDEVIVIDDGSTDESVAVIESFAVRHPAIRFLRGDRNRGVEFCLNWGIDVARGEFLYLAPADDRVLPWFFERSLRLLDKQPGAGMSFTDFAFLDPRQETLTAKHLGFGLQAGYYSSSELVARLCRGADTIPGLTSLVRREVLSATGKLPEELRWHSDWFAIFVIAFRHGACYLPEPLVAFRPNPGSYSQRALRDWSAQKEVLTALLSRLQASEFEDVREAFLRSGVLSKFGFQMVRVAAAHPRHRPVLRMLPYRRIAWREVKNLLIRLGPQWLRRAFWIARYRWKIPPSRVPASEGYRPSATPWIAAKRSQNRK